MRREMRRRVRLVATCAAAALCCSLAASGTAHAADGVHAAATIDVTSRATGGSAIPSSTARIGGTGAWTQLTGPRLREGALDLFEAGWWIFVGLPPNFEWNTARTGAPRTDGCDLSASATTYPAGDDVAVFELRTRDDAPLMGRCTIDFGEILQVRPIDGRTAAGTGGAIWLAFRRPWTRDPVPIMGADAGLIRMVVPPPHPTIIPATGGEAIQSSTARIGGDGSWATLTGPRIVETLESITFPPLGLALNLPPNFEWNAANTTPPRVTGCSRTIERLEHPSATRLIARLTWVREVLGDTPCTIDFGRILQVRPRDASATTGIAGDIVLGITDPASGVEALVGSAGRIAMVATPPPAVTLSLAAVAPTAINGAILWGEGVDLVTTGPAGTMFSLQVTTDNETWTTLADAAGAPLAFTIGADGTSTYRYRPVRNYWYRAVAGTSLSNTPRVTVRQTIVVRPIHTGTRHVATGTAVTFTATVRPAGPALPTASVRFELYRRSGSRWVLSRSVAVAVDLSGVASTTFTFARGSWYVRAQAQPTRVNANSLWTPSQYYTAP
jgi:hypothetical protein